MLYLRAQEFGNAAPLHDPIFKIYYPVYNDSYKEKSIYILQL